MLNYPTLIERPCLQQGSLAHAKIQQITLESLIDYGRIEWHENLC